MITDTQLSEIRNYLKSKSLPLDLFVEVSDHFMEQIDYKINFENKTFDEAFEEVQLLWSKDLKLKKGYTFPRKPKTVLERKTIAETEKKFLLKFLLIFAPPFAISIFLMLFYPNYGYYFCLAMHIIFLVIGLYFIVSEYKLIKTSRPKKRKNLSYAEAGSYGLVISTLYIICFVLVNYDLKFSIIVNALQEVKQLQISFKGFINFITFFCFDWGVIYGLLFFLEYRKSVNTLKQRLKIDL